MGGCHSHSLASPHLVSGVLSDHVGINDIIFEQNLTKVEVVVQKLIDRAKIQHVPRVD